MRQSRWDQHVCHLQTADHSASRVYQRGEQSWNKVRQTHRDASPDDSRNRQGSRLSSGSWSANAAIMVWQAEQVPLHTTCFSPGWSYSPRRTGSWGRSVRQSRWDQHVCHLQTADHSASRVHQRGEQSWNEVRQTHKDASPDDSRNRQGSRLSSGSWSANAAIMVWQAEQVPLHTTCFSPGWSYSPRRTGSWGRTFRKPSGSPKDEPPRTDGEGVELATPT